MFFCKCSKLFFGGIGALWLTLTSSSVVADDEIDPGYLFVDAHFDTGVYRTAKEACAAAMPKSRYSNPRGGFRAGYGIGCEYRVELSPGEIYDSWFGQNWLAVIRVCPNGYAFNSDTVKCTSSKAHNDDSCRSGNPVATATGTKQQLEVDFSVNNNPAPLRIARYYTSRTPEPTVHFGQGWALKPYSQKLAHFSSIGRVSIYRTPDERWDFNLDSGIYRRVDAPGITLSMVTSDEGALWVLKGSEYDEEVYDTQGKLIELRIGGHWNRLRYSDASTPLSVASAPGLLTHVTDENLRELAFFYTDENMLARVSFAGSDIATYQYGAQSASGVRILNSVTFTSGEQRRYLYDQLIPPGTGPITQTELASVNLVGTGHSIPQEVLDADTLDGLRLAKTGYSVSPLVGIIDENGEHYATWAYDDQGRAVSSRHAGDTDDTTLTFNTDGTTTVTNALGKQTTYHFEVIHGVYKVTHIEGHPTATCAGANQSYTYDTNGFLASKTDWNGITTTYVHDAQGRELSRTEAAGTPEARTITTEWHSQWRLPVRITEPGKVTTFSYDDKGQLLSRSETPAP